ncbi:myb-like protein X isoform X2 [Agrilus planipennis]|uniref:MOG interacting and ectopic P-granules protein 1 n=1 Tax=Agrilus planipennis TaxID=224129 RepID=A0A7F5RLC9_AGRPL|nr:myb-like protein X isoform X2 [Agrilus planipennis]
MVSADNPNQSISTKNAARKRVSSGSLYDMAAVDAMGEVDEMPSTEENFKNDVALNGDRNDEDSAEAAVKATKTVADITDNSLPPSEPMEVGELEASNNEEQENISDSQDDENSNHSHEDNEMDVTEDSKDSKQLTEEEDDEDDDEYEEDEGDDERDDGGKVEAEIENGSCDSQERETDEVSCASQEIAGEETESVKNDNSRATSALSNNTDESKEVQVIDSLAGGKESKSDSAKQSDDNIITLNDSNENDTDIVIIDGKENSSSDANQNRKHKISECDEVIDLDSPVKKKKKAKAPPPELPARRSSRNLNKERKSYVEEDDYELEVEKRKRADSEESDIEEVLPEDPLAVTDSIHNELRIGNKGTNSPSSTIVVKDTKRLVEIASQSNNSNISKKEPTLVIIDTNSILSGRGPIPISQKSTAPSPSLSTSAFNMLPMALPAQGVYPANMRATITPIPIGASTPKGSATSLLSPVSVSSGSGQPILSSVVLPTVQSNAVHVSSVVHQPTLLSATAQASQSLAPPPLLPTLTDDMFVVEAPSFIVPYVYEKPPMKDMKEFLKEVLEKEAEEKKKKEEEEERKRKEEEKEKEQRKKEEEERKDKEEEAKEKADDEKMEVDEDEEKEDRGDKKDESDLKLKEIIETVEEENEEDKEAKKNKDNTPKDLCDDTKKEKESDKKAEETKTKESDKEKDQNEKKEVSSETNDKNESPKLKTYFDTPLGSFFVDLGFNLVQEFVQNDLLRQQKRKRDREQGQNAKTNKTIASLIKNLEFSKENNEPFRMEMKKCQFCSFRTESSLAMAFHLETPHMKNYIYRCNFCPYEIRSPHDILFHMEAEHGVRGRLERAPAFHQCPNCPFEDNQKGKLSRHLVACARKFRPERNLEPPGDWDPPAKIPRAPRMKQTGLNATAAMYQAMAQRASNPYQIMQKLVHQQPGLQMVQRGRGRPSLGTVKTPPNLKNTGGMVYKQMSGGSVFVPTSYQLSGNQVFQVVGGQEMGARLATVGSTAFVPNLSTAPPTSVTIQQQAQQSQSTVKSKPVQQPSISITPLPRGSASSNSTSSTMLKPGDSSSKNSFVICEICDGYIKDLEQLRNHMQWIHKVKIHPKMIYNRPPLNCQKCQFRFFTDQGLERHLLGSHGLVTSSMQEAANKSKDAGRCPVCGRVYQWKLLNHVARDHNMTLKPAHLSYKCTVCTATFGMYKQFENHVYSAHSVVAKRVMDKKGSSSNNLGSSGSSSSSSKNDSTLLKPLKINDEITIIPQPAKLGKDMGGFSSRIDTGINKSNLSESSLSLLSRAERLVRQKTASHSRTGD